jgi:pyruvate,water dikinase
LLPVAVRSSATAEDLPGASFAGQQDTYLNVRGKAALLEAVKRCWASLWTARAMTYRARRGIDSSMVSLAVVVQQMVAADAAGVLFTANPMTGKRDEIVINAAWGLGEAIVAGHVTPDTLILDKATGRVNQVDIGTKDVMTVQTDQGTVEVQVESQQRQQPVLGEAQIAELARLGSAIEAHFGAPQDVEWAMDGEGIYILQSRPVTSPLDTSPVWGEAGEASTVPGDDDWPVLGEGTVQPFDGWTLANIGELWPEPVSPLVASTVPMLMNVAVRASFRGVNPEILHPIQWAKRFYGRMYYNEGAQTYLLSHELGLPASLLDRSRGNTRGAESKLRPVQVLRHLPVLLRLATRQWRSGQQFEALFPQIDRWVADFLGRSLNEQSDRELLDEALLWLDRTKQALGPQNELGGLSMASLGVLERLTINWFDREDLTQDLMTGLAGIQAAEIGADLWHMAQKLDKLGLARVVLDNDPDVALDELRQAPEAEPVIKLLDTFLPLSGWNPASVHCAGKYFAEP